MSDYIVEEEQSIYDLLEIYFAQHPEILRSTLKNGLKKTRSTQEKVLPLLSL